jgi:hypothetical protein
MTGVWIFFSIYLAFGCAAGVFVLGLCRAAARGDEQAQRQYAELDEPRLRGDTSMVTMSYNPADGQEVPSAGSASREWTRLLQPPTTPSESGDSGRRGDC